MSEQSERLYDAITDIKDEHVERARSSGTAKRRRRKWWMAGVAAAVAAAIAVGAVFRPWGGAGDSLSAAPTAAPSALPTAAPGGDPAPSLAYTLAAAVYPETAPLPEHPVMAPPTPEALDAIERGDRDAYREAMAPYVEAYQAAWDDYLDAYALWELGRQARRELRDSSDGLEAFFAESARQFLSGAEGENAVCSPLNVYLALAMLAELTGGESRQQILDLLGSGSIEALRAQANSVWQANYIDDGAVSTILASSLWLNENKQFRQAALDTLAQNYFASSFQGKMGSEELDQALQDWLNEQTGGLLEEQAGHITLSANTVMALATTIYFNGKWAGAFSPEETAAGTFHASTGDVTCDFMHQSDFTDFFRGDRFSAAGRSLDYAGTMYFLLPDEGVTVDELLSDAQVTGFLSCPGDWESRDEYFVNWSVPKFDVTSQMDLAEGLKELGVTDVFDPALSDFSPMTEDPEGIYASRIEHDVRVTIDEEGCTAAAYTVDIKLGGPMPSGDEVDFVLDRPFLFAILSDAGDPLFLGVVNQPIS